MDQIRETQRFKSLIRFGQVRITPVLHDHGGKLACLYCNAVLTPKERSSGACAVSAEALIGPLPLLQQKTYHGIVLSHVLKVESIFGGFPLMVTPPMELLITPFELIQMGRYFIVFIREIPKAHILELIPLSPWRKNGDRLGPLIYTHTEHLSPRPVGLSVPFLGFASKSVLGSPPKVFSVVSGRLYVET